MDLISELAEGAQDISIELLVWSSLLSLLLLLPVLVLSFYQLRGQPVPEWLNTSRPIIRKMSWWVILVWPVFVFLGWLVAGRPGKIVFFMGPINLFVSGIPVLWVYNAAQWKLKAGSSVRKWRIFGFSLTVTPIVIIFVETLVLIVLGMVGAFWLTYRMAVDPVINQEMIDIANQISLAGNDLDTVLLLLEPYLLSPSVIFWAMAIFGGIMPIIEEILKPIALWSLAGRNITPQEGFVGGILCGAGFALMENILYATTAIIAEDWLFLVIARVGTGVLHMLASGLVGWGLARLWRDGKWFFSALTTLASFLLHSVWNVLALFLGVAPLFVFGKETSLWQTTLIYSPLLLLLVLSALGLYFVHKYLIGQQSKENQINWEKN